MRSQLPFTGYISRFSFMGVAVALALVVPALMISDVSSRGLPAVGIYVHVPKPSAVRYSATGHVDEPLLVQVDKDGKLYLNGKRLLKSELQNTLSERLKRRADRLVYFWGDSTLSFADVADVLDTIRGTLDAEVVIVTARGYAPTP